MTKKRFSCSRVTKTTASYTIPEPKSLNPTEDAKFLREMQVLPNLADYVRWTDQD